MSDLILKDKIVSQSFRLFCEYGVSEVSFLSIANAINECEEGIRQVFETKEELVIATGKWKMEKVGFNVDAVVDMDLPVIDKLYRYLTVIDESISDASMKVVTDLFAWKGYLKEVMTDYLKEAVYGRFARIIDQAKTEMIIREDIEPADALYNYWEMLSSVLAMNPSDEVPIEIKSGRPMSYIVCGGIFDIYTQILKPNAVRKLELLVLADPRLSKIHR